MMVYDGTGGWGGGGRGVSYSSYSCITGVYRCV